MPSVSELGAVQRNDLIIAIGKHGGFPAVADQLRLERPNARKSIGYWDDFDNVRQELQAFIQEHGTSGVMPTQTELVQVGRNSLSSAIREHGGFAVVARHLGLTHIGPEFVTVRTASSVERTARAIQPLAESNLLSPAQIMVILRRAGSVGISQSTRGQVGCKSGAWRSRRDRIGHCQSRQRRRRDCDRNHRHRRTRRPHCRRSRSTVERRSGREARQHRR